MHRLSLKLCSCEKTPEKNRGLAGINHDCDTDQGSNQFATASHVTGSWSLNLFVLYPGKMKMKWQIHEFSYIGTPECGNKCQIVPVKDATYAREKRCTSMVEVMVRIAASLNFFRLSGIYCFNPQLQYMKFIYSSFHNYYRWALD